MLSATGLCINPGGNHPKAVNKGSFTAKGDFPVQNGRAEFTLSVTATFTPECSPPMTVAFTDVTVTDETNGLTKSFPGTFQPIILRLGVARTQRSERKSPPTPLIAADAT